MTKRRLSRQQVARIQQIQERRRERATRRAARRAEQLEDERLGPEQRGLVIANYGTNAIVESSLGQLFRCVVRQNLETLVCGDSVVWQVCDSDEGVVVALERRHTLLKRPDYSGRLKPVAANLDQAMVVIAPRPEPNEFLIDRYLVALATANIEALLVLNKVDLPHESELKVLRKRLATYERIGYPLLLSSTRGCHGLDELHRHLKNRTSILVGQSGVGKSSLIKTLLPDRDIRIQALSATTGFGTHTTTASMLYHLADGGDLIDSPGVRSFEPGQVTPIELETGFIEFRPYLGQCRFSNCRHTVEPKCAVQAAVASGVIDPRRLESFYQIRATLPEHMG